MDAASLQWPLAVRRDRPKDPRRSCLYQQADARNCCWRHFPAGDGRDKPTDRDGRQRAHKYGNDNPPRSEEHTSELQSLMRISYAVFCLKKKTIQRKSTTYKTKENDKGTYANKKD